MKQYSIGCMLLLLVLIILFGVSTQYRDGFMDDQGSDDQGSDDQGSGDQGSGDQGSGDQGSDQDQDDQDQDDQEPGMSSLRRQLPPMVSSCVKDGLRQFDDLQ